MSEGLATSLPTDLKCQESSGSPEAQDDQLSATAGTEQMALQRLTP